MSLINDIYVELKNLFQKHGRGFLTPDEFSGGAQYVQSKIVREAFDFIDSLKNKSKIGRINKGDYDRLKYYKEVVRGLLADPNTLTYNSTTERFEFPDDYSFTQALYYDNKEVDEIPRDDRIILNNYATSPTEYYPISIYHSVDIEVLPDTIISGVVLYYYREALSPLWTYNIVNSQPLFNQDLSDYQDFELPSSIFDEILVEMAKYFGIELRNPEMAQAFNSEDKRNESLKRVD